MPECSEGPSRADGYELDYSWCPGDAGIALYPSLGAVGRVHGIPDCDGNTTHLPVSRHPKDISLAGSCLNAITGRARPVAPDEVALAGDVLVDAGQHPQIDVPHERGDGLEIDAPQDG